jgi:LAS superfamily LD-carboxypeptidase LdcB
MKKFDLRGQHALIAFAILLGFGIYSFTRIHSLSGELAIAVDRIAALDQRVASTTSELAKVSRNADDSLQKQAINIALLQQKLGIYSNQVSGYSSTVADLQKLSKTDPQILAKYSKVFFLSENYAPARLSEVPEDYRYSSTKSVSVHSDVLPKLEAMIDAAKKDNITLLVSSGYRSFAEQKNLKGDYKVTYGAGTANSFSADQGYSEHQLGTAVDFTTTGLGGGLDGFDKTPAFAWLLTNAYKYGFILSYPPNNQYYVFEPWHWRYVGVKLATDLRNQGKNFYDLDQRTIDTYLVSVF